MKSTADAVIIGGGVMGCSTLYNLANLGMKNTVLIERDVLGSGSTGRSQAILRMHYSNPITSAMAWESLKVFKEFNSLIGGNSGYVKTGYVVLVGEENRTPLTENVDMHRKLGIETSIISEDDLQVVAPMLRASDVGGIAYEPQSGYADPYSVTAGYAQRSRELGSNIYMRVSATDILVKSGKVTGVVTDKGTIETDTVLVASGPWSSRLFRLIGVDIPLFTTRHQIVTVGRPPGLIPTHPGVGDIIQEFSFRPDSSDLTLIGIGEESVCDPDLYNEGIDSSVAEDAIVKLAKRFPAMEDGFLRGGWSGLFTNTPDFHPILDRVPGVGGLFCAVGFSGHGFKLSPMIGLTMAELITGGKATTFDLTPLRFSRFEEGDMLRSRYPYHVLA